MAAAWAGLYFAGIMVWRWGPSLKLKPRIEGYLIKQHISSHQHGVRQQACANILPLQHTRGHCPCDQKA